MEPLQAPSLYDKFEHSSAVIVAHLHTKINHGLDNAADAVDRPPCAYEFIWPYLRPAYLTAALTLTRLSLTKGHAISADDTDHGGGCRYLEITRCVLFFFFFHCWLILLRPSRYQSAGATKTRHEKKKMCRIRRQHKNAAHDRS